MRSAVGWRTTGRLIAIRAAALVVLASAVTACDWIRNSVLGATPCAKLPAGAADREPPPPIGAREAIAPRCDRSRPPPADFVSVQRVLIKNCGTAGACHLAGRGSEAGLDFASTETYAALIHDAEGASRCAKQLGIQKRVLPRDANRSMLYRVITSNDCGAHMPLGGGYLSCDEQGVIFGWIQQGAPPPVTPDVSAAKKTASSSPPPRTCQRSFP
jgi:hypothetical protein